MPVTASDRTPKPERKQATRWPCASSCACASDVHGVFNAFNIATRSGRSSANWSFKSERSTRALRLIEFSARWGGTAPGRPKAGQADNISSAGVRRPRWFMAWIIARNHVFAKGTTVNKGAANGRLSLKVQDDQRRVATLTRDSTQFQRPKPCGSPPVVPDHAVQRRRSRSRSCFGRRWPLDRNENGFLIADDRSARLFHRAPPLRVAPVFRRPHATLFAVRGRGQVWNRLRSASRSPEALRAPSGPSLAGPTARLGNFGTATVRRGDLLATRCRRQRLRIERVRRVRSGIAARRRAESRWVTRLSHGCAYRGSPARARLFRAHRRSPTHDLWSEINPQREQKPVERPGRLRMPG